MSTLLPLLYLLFGISLGRFYPTVKNSLAKLLTKILIPFVIIYNLMDYQSGTIFFAIFSIIFCILLFASSYTIWNNRLSSLTLSYLNIGWLGLPIAISLFGDEVSQLIIAAYIGSSIFGNIASSVALPSQQNWSGLLYRTIKTPPVLAVIAGLLLYSLPFKPYDNKELTAIYYVAKQFMSLSGMAILGIWLYGSKVSFESLLRTFPQSLFRVIAGALIIIPFILLCHVLDIFLSKESIWVLFMLPLLPPAANIIVLETYYCGTGKSAKSIISGTIISLVFISIFSLFAMSR